MLFNVDSQRYVTNIPHKSEFDVWRIRLAPDELNVIRDNLEDLLNDAEIKTSSWIPGHDWTNTAWAPIYERACLQDEDLSARCFGIFVWEAVLTHPEVWGFGRYEKDGVPIEGMTYFRLGSPPPPPPEALALVRRG